MEQALRDVAQDHFGDAALQVGNLERITPPDRRTLVAVVAFWIIVIVLVAARIGAHPPTETAGPIVRGMSAATNLVPV